MASRTHWVTRLLVVPLAILAAKPGPQQANQAWLPAGQQEIAGTEYHVSWRPAGALSRRGE